MPNNSVARTLTVTCVATACWSFGFGLSAPLCSLWLKDGGYSATVIGLNTGVYYTGIILAAGFVPGLMRRMGQGCTIAGMAISGFAVALFPWTDSLTAWHGLRLMHGLAAAMSLIPMETLTNQHPPPEHRARNFGFYAFSVALGWALGNFVGLQLYPAAPRFAFVLGGTISFCGAAVALLWMPSTATATEERQEHTPLEWRRTFFGFGSAWSQGYLEGGMVALLPVYLLAIGLTSDGVSWLTSGIMIGVILFQVPVAWLADRWGRSAVLLGCYAVVALGLALLPFCGVSPWLAIWLFLVGACSGAYYPLGLAIIGERVPNSGLARANAYFLAINCLGSLTGPVITGAAMDLFGNRAMFAAGEAAVLFILIVSAAMRLHSFVRRGCAGAPDSSFAPRGAEKAA